MSISTFGAMLHVNPDDARTRILDAIKAKGGDRKAAALELGITHRSLYRYIESLHMWEAIDSMITANGLKNSPGPARSSVRIADAIVEHRGDMVRAARALDIKVKVLRERVKDLDLIDAINARLALAGSPLLKKD